MVMIKEAGKEQGLDTLSRPGQQVTTPLFCLVKWLSAPWLAGHDSPVLLGKVFWFCLKSLKSHTHTMYRRKCDSQLHKIQLWSFLCTYIQEVAKAATHLFFPFPPLLSLSSRPMCRTSWDSQRPFIAFPLNYPD